MKKVLLTLAVMAISMAAYALDLNSYAEGTYLVLIAQDGQENVINLVGGDSGDSYVTLTDVAFWQYGPEGTYAGFYFVIDGVAYGAPVDGTEAVLGNAMFNELVGETTNLYTLPTGYSYSICIQFNDGSWYCYVAKGLPTAVNELAADKTVASTRYYNVAGQQMPQANGLTIVVTTYTDGTTATSKVFK